MTTTQAGPLEQYAGGLLNDLRLGTSTNQSGISTGYDRLTSFDSPGPPYVKNNEFESIRIRWTPGRWNGISSNRYQYTNWRCNMGFTSNSLFSPVASGSIQQSWVNKALADINPSVPVIQLPLVAWEMREFPRLLKNLFDWYRVLKYNEGIPLSEVPGTYLAWQFGWKPLVNDLMTLVQLAFDIEAKNRQWRKIIQKRRRYGTILEEDGTYRLSSTTGAVGVSESWSMVQYQRKVWYCAIWEPDTELPDLALNGALDQVYRAYGMHQPINMLWNAVPWSFLIDYFLGVSDFLEASEGLVKFKPAVICFMESVDETLADQGVTTSSSASGAYTPGSMNRKVRRRWVRYDPLALPSWAVNPWMDRLNILASLQTSSALRRMGK
jgi:hypothetical protein